MQIMFDTLQIVLNIVIIVCLISLLKKQEVILLEKINITLEAARVNAGYTQEQAASNLGVSRSTIINWENGKTIPGIPSMHKMSQLYGIPLDCIFLPCYSTNSRIKIKEGESK